MSQPIEVARRRQTTIPKNVREQFGIRDGQEYALNAVEGGVIILTPRKGKAAAAVTELREKRASKGASLEEMLAELRRMR